MPRWLYIELVDDGMIISLLLISAWMGLRYALARTLLMDIIYVIRSYNFSVKTGGCWCW